MDDIPRSILTLALILFGGSFAGSETALSSCNKIRIRNRAEEGSSADRRVVSILDRFDKALSTILIGTNVCYVFASSFAAVLFLKHFGTPGAVLSTVVMTLLIFLFAETIPKNFARANADAYARACALPLSVLMVILTPLTLLFSGISAFVKKLLPEKPEQPTVTEDEFTTMIENISEEGLLEPEETELIRSAVEFGDTTAGEIMTPLSEMCSVSITETPENLRELLLREKYSRIPVYAGSRERIVGVLQSKDVLWLLAHGQEADIGSIMKLTYDVPPEMPLQELFEGLGRRRTHLAIVVNELGEALGFVTMEDILEELVGEIYDEEDASENGGQEA